MYCLIYSILIFIYLFSYIAKLFSYIAFEQNNKFKQESIWSNNIKIDIEKKLIRDYINY